MDWYDRAPILDRVSAKRIPLCDVFTTVIGLGHLHGKGVTAWTYDVQDNNPNNVTIQTICQNVQRCEFSYFHAVSRGSFVFSYGSAVTHYVQLCNTLCLTIELTEHDPYGEAVKWTELLLKTLICWAEISPEPANILPQ